MKRGVRALLTMLQRRGFLVLVPVAVVLTAASLWSCSGYGYTAEGLDPIPMINHSCPIGWQESAGNWCVPTGPSSRPAIPRFDHSCPVGWQQSGAAYCLKNKD